ncbi:hypothetical protein FB451DRAFT_1554597 [Mycena latifolia]|nr:hypothetical protein FB451DRAFT_1554597 [Mycena latifolia]
MPYSGPSRSYTSESAELPLALHLTDTPTRFEPGNPFSHAPSPPPPPIIRSTGRRAKSSLKAASAPHTGTPPARLRPRSPSLPSPPKTVHFPAPDAEVGLVTVRLFRRHARPASIARADDTVPEPESEAETETESDAVPWPRWVSPAGAPRVRSPLNAHAQVTAPQAHAHAPWRYVLEAPSVPCSPEPGSMVLLEGLALHLPADSGDSEARAPDEPALRGTLLARNAAFEKHLSVRFTFDGWCTTSEVGARWVESAARSPASNSNPGGAGADAEEPGPGWDRFAFSICLADYGVRGDAAGAGGGRGPDERELVLAARFCTPWVCAGAAAPYVWCDALAGTGRSASGRAWVGTGHGGAAGPGEWWDNNGAHDHRARVRGASLPFAAASSSLAAPALGTGTGPAPRMVPAPGMVPFPMRGGAHGADGGGGDSEEGECEAEPPPTRGAGVVSWTPAARSPPPAHQTPAVPGVYKALVSRWCFAGAGRGVGMGAGMGGPAGAAIVI